MFDDIILPILTGIISGVVSSIIVTQFYRIKDRERDRVRYFEELRAFYEELKNILWIIPDSQTVAKLNKMKMPKLYKWIYVKKEEKSTIDKISAIYFTVKQIAYKISSEIFELETVQRQDDEIEFKKVKIYLNYSNDLTNCLKELEKINEDVYYLEHPEVKEVFNKIREKNNTL